MRKIAWIIVGLALLWPFSLSAQSGDYDRASFARVTYVKGDVMVDRAGDLGSEEATVNLALVEGDKIGSREGRAEVDFGKKNFLRLDRQTEVELSNLPRSGDNRTRLHVLSGRVYLRVNGLDQEKTIEVHTPDVSYYVLEPGLYRVEVRPNAETELAVVEGSIEAAGEGGSQLISSRERLVASNGRLGSQGSFSYSRDDFDNFNENRDSLHSQYVSNQYLPSELGDYEGELADNGTWVYEQPYGYVWSPTINYSDWRPYYYGRWNWYASCGWTWIPEESWGWPVYHYGRWQWRLGLGWYWIPHQAWGPAWVHWYHGDDYYGWCPLSWYNYPSVLVDNYYYDRYHGSHFPGHNRAMTVVHKGQLQDRHISRVALSRQQAGSLGQISLAGRQPDVRPVVNRSGLRGVDSLGSGARPQIRSFERTLDRSSLGSLSRATARTFSGNRSNGSIGRSNTGRTVSSGSLSPNGRVTPNPGSAVGSRSVDRSSAGTRSIDSPPAGGTQTSPRRARPQSGISSRPNSSGSSSSVRTYGPSSRPVSPDRGASVQRREAPRRYSPSASISRFGASALGSGSASEPRTPDRGRLTGGRSSISSRGSSGTGYRPAPWPPSPYTAGRLEKSSGESRNSPGSYSGSQSSSGRSFSAPNRSYSGLGRSYSASNRSYSGSARSYSSPDRSSSGSGRSFSAPSRSSSSPSRPSSSSSRSYSAPSRSSSGSGRSVSSGSSGGSSRSSSSSSRGSGGGAHRRG
jgi:Family of unknown function (DUF6600)